MMITHIFNGKLTSLEEASSIIYLLFLYPRNYQYRNNHVMNNYFTLEISKSNKLNVVIASETAFN